MKNHLVRFLRVPAIATGVLLLSIATAASADTLSPAGATSLLNEAISAIDEDYRREWAFTETAIDSETTTVGRYDPRRSPGERWQLISVDGREPSEDELVAFSEDKAADEPDEEREGGRSDDNVADMVQPDSLSLLEETGDYWLFSFVPNDDEDEGFLEKMDGTLRIAKDGRYLERLDIESREPFKPAIGVKVHRFLTSLTFGPAAGSGPIVPLTVEFRVKARAYLLMNVDEAGSVTYTDFEYVGD